MHKVNASQSENSEISVIGNGHVAENFPLKEKTLQVIFSIDKNVNSRPHFKKIYAQSPGQTIFWTLTIFKLYSMNRKALIWGTFFDEGQRGSCLACFWINESLCITQYILIQISKYRNNTQLYKLQQLDLTLQIKISNQP